MFTAIHIPLNDFLARTETTLLARKTKYIMGEEDVIFHDMHYLQALRKVEVYLSLCTL